MEEEKNIQEQREFEEMRSSYYRSIQKTKPSPMVNQAFISSILLSHIRTVCKIKNLPFQEVFQAFTDAFFEFEKINRDNEEK